MKVTNNIVKQINEADYVVLDILGFWTIHIDKNKNEIFQENHYHINQYNDFKTALENDVDSIGVLFYVIARSCLSSVMLEKWAKYIDNVLLNQRIAYKIVCE